MQRHIAVDKLFITIRMHACTYACINTYTCMHIFSGFRYRPPHSTFLPHSQLHRPATTARPLLWLFLSRHRTLHHHAESTLLQIADQEATSEAEHHQGTDGIQSEVWGTTYAEEYQETALPDHKVRGGVLLFVIEGA